MTAKESKNIKIGVGVAAAAALIYYLSQGAPAGSQSDPTGNGGIFNPGGSNGGGVAQFDANRVATILFDAMREMGTDRDAIFAALKNVNESQFTQVMQKFGKRSYNTTTGNQYNFFPITPLPLYDLPFWLKSELSTKDYGTLRAKYPNKL